MVVQQSNNSCLQYTQLKRKPILMHVGAQNISSPWLQNIRTFQSCKQQCYTIIRCLNVCTLFNKFIWSEIQTSNIRLLHMQVLHFDSLCPDHLISELLTVTIKSVKLFSAITSREPVHWKESTLMRISLMFNMLLLLYSAQSILLAYT